jgi:hypothetical protein
MKNRPERSRLPSFGTFPKHRRFSSTRNLQLWRSDNKLITDCSPLTTALQWQQF